MTQPAMTATAVASALAASKTPDEYKVAPKIYFHSHNGAKFHVNLGNAQVRTLEFISHKVITDDKRDQDQLNEVADRPGTFIYTMPDSEAQHYMERFFQEEQKKQVLAAAQAASAVANRPFDANVPIVPAMAHPGHAVTGMQHSFSGTQATESLQAVMTTPETQVAPPSAIEVAKARIAALEQNKLS